MKTEESQLRNELINDVFERKIYLNKPAKNKIYNHTSTHTQEISYISYHTIEKETMIIKIRYVETIMIAENRQEFSLYQIPQSK